MKTMLELLIRLQEMRGCCERAQQNAQLTPGEKATVGAHKRLVRECLPPEVLKHYDQMKRTERALRACPEVFAMAVLVSSYRSLSPAGRRKLAAHFASPPPGRSLPVEHGTQKRTRGRRRRATVAAACAVGEPGPR